MKRIKLHFTFWICGLSFLGIFTHSAFAIEYKYIFSAAQGELTEFNGTTIDLEVTAVSGQSQFVNVASFNFEVQNASWLPGTPPIGFSLSPSGTYAEDFISDATPLGWIGSCYGYSDFILDGAGGTLSWVMSDSEVGFYIDGAPEVPSQYACGTWALVPDTCDTLELLIGALVALQVGCLFARGRKGLSAG